MLTPTFETVSGEAYSIQGLVPSAEGDGTMTIQTMDDAGAWVGEYTWFTEDIVGLPNGWYNADGVLASETLTSGKAVFVACPKSGITMQFAGQVKLDAAKNPCAKGYTMSGNSKPIAVAVSNIGVELTDGEIAPGDGTITIQTMDAAGSWVGEYTWYTEDIVGLPNGWYDAEGVSTSVVLQPGESVFVSSTDVDINFVVPEIK